MRTGLRIKSGRLRFVAVAGALTTVVALVAAGTSGASGATLSVAQLSAIAVREAAGAGEATPTDISYAQGPRANAVQVASGDVVQGDSSSYLIVLHGHFVVQGSQGLPGSPTPTGSVMTLVVDAASGNITDFGVAPVTPALSKLGPVTVIPPAAVENAERAAKARQGH
jgi:hypothetical protein